MCFLKALVLKNRERFWPFFAVCQGEKCLSRQERFQRILGFCVTTC